MPVEEREIPKFLVSRRYISVMITFIVAFSALFMIIGTVIMISAYPIYRRIAHKTKAELTPEILRLSEEIMKS